jgi:hypothetical protein
MVTGSALNGVPAISTKANAVIVAEQLVYENPSISVNVLGTDKSLNIAVGSCGSGSAFIFQLTGKFPSKTQYAFAMLPPRSSLHIVLEFGIASKMFEYFGCCH